MERYEIQVPTVHPLGMEKLWAKIGGVNKMSRVEAKIYMWFQVDR